MSASFGSETDSDKHEDMDLIIELHREKELALHLQQAGTIEGIDVIHTDDSLSTIFDSLSEDDDSNECDCVNSQPDVKNKLYDSLPNMEWEQCVNKLEQLAHSNGKMPHGFIRTVLDRRFGKETISQAFDCLHILDKLPKYLTHGQDQRVVRSRESQLRRRIYKLQRDRDARCFFVGG